MRDAADDVVALEDDRREVAVAEAGNLDRVAAQPLPRAGESQTGPVHTRTASTGTWRKE